MTSSKLFFQTLENCFHVLNISPSSSNTTKDRPASGVSSQNDKVGGRVVSLREELCVPFVFKKCYTNKA